MLADYSFTLIIHSLTSHPLALGVNVDISSADGASHYCVKFFVADQFVVVEVRPQDHSIELFLANIFPQLQGHSPQVLYRDVACPLVVEQREYLVVVPT